MAGTIIGETKKKAKERPKNAQPIGSKFFLKELVSLMAGNYYGRKLFHPCPL
jgi:hypothetical protein